MTFRRASPPSLPSVPAYLLSKPTGHQTCELAEREGKERGTGASVDFLPGPPLPLLASGTTAGPPACWARDALHQGWRGHRSHPWAFLLHFQR